MNLWVTTGKTKSFSSHLMVFLYEEDTLWLVCNLPFRWLHFIFSHLLFLTQSTNNFPINVCTHVNINKIWIPKSAFILTYLCGSLLVWGWHLLASVQKDITSWSYFLLLYLSSTWSLSLGGYISAWHAQSTYEVWRGVRGAGWSNSEI